MKTRLFMLLSVFMTITSVGWLQAQDITYYKTGSGSGGIGTIQDPIVKTSLDEILTDANAKTESDSIVVSLSDGDYTATSDAFSITKSGISIIGTDSNKVVIKSPFDITLSGKGNVSFSSLQITAATATGRGLVDIKSSKTTVSFVDTKLNIEGAGTADGGSTACFGIVSQLEVDNNTVNFIASHMYMSKGFQRGLCFRDGAGHTLNMENSKIDGPSGASGYSYVIGIGSWPGATSVTEPVTYNIKNSVVDVNYYAVFTNNQTTPAVPVVINIEGSNITAWSALYLRGDQAQATFPHTVKISDTRLNGRSYNNGPSDGFGTIVLDNCQQMDLTMDSKCRITATNKKIQSSVNTYMVVADVRKNTKGTWTFLPVNGDTCLIQSNNDVYTPTLFALESTAALTIKGIENVKFQSEGGKPCITVYKADGSFRNAATDVTTLLTNVSISEGDKVVFPEGTFTFPQPFVLNKSLTIEGAGKDKTNLTGTVQVTATAGAKVNFNNLHLSASSTDKHAIEVGTNKGSESPDITIANCIIDNANNGVRLMGAGAKLTLKNTDITAHYYGVSVRNEKQTLSIDGGTIKGWAAIMTSAGGLTTTDGTLASTGTSIDVKNAILKSATISNEGYGVIVLQEKYNGVTLSIDGSTLEATDENVSTNEAGVRALSALDIRSYGNKVTVKGSTLSSLYGENYYKLGNDTLHAAIINLGWHGSDDKSTLADNMIEITNSQLNGKTGENPVYSYRDKEEKAYDKLTINGKIYDPASGLICYGEQDLQSKLDHAIAGETILLPVGTYELSKQLTIKEAVTLQGTITDKDSTILIAAGDWSGSDGSSKHLVSIQANGAALKNLVIDGSKSPAEGTGSGINVYTSTGVTLDNVISRNNKAAGLIVNGSTVSATNFRTSGNGWYGVNVDKGEGVEGTPVFTIGTGCSFAEAVAVLSDDANAPANYVVGNGWFKTKQTGSGKTVSVWINGATSGLNFAITSVPATVVYGQANLPLLTNVDSAYYKADKVHIASNNTDVANVVSDSLQILKPGEAVLTLSVGDTAVTQSLTVLKKTLTITDITAKTKTYDGSKNVTLDTTQMNVNGLVGDHKYVVTVPTTGEAFSANAGVQPVTVKATLKGNYGDYYDLADITGVMDTITKVPLTVTATATANSQANVDTLTVDYGTLPEFGVTYSDFVNQETETTENVLKGSIKYNSSATTTSLAGTYSVTPSGLTADNYDISYESAPFKIAAIAPTVEMTGVKVVSLGTEGENNASVEVTGHVISNGGTKTTDLKGNFKVKTDGSYTDKSLSLDVDKDGMFSTILTGLSNVKTHILASAKAGGSLISSDGDGDTKAMSVDLALKLQNVSFTSTFKALTYGIDPISLSAEDFVEGAKVAFTSSDPAILAISDSNKMVVQKPGVATITVTATKEGHIIATAKQTITVNKKALAVTPKAITKMYDGTTAVEVTGELPKLEGLQTASLTKAVLAANFANKNVGSSISVKLVEEFELSAGSDYYELIQPTNLTGTITSGGDVTVVISDVSRNYNEKALRYDLKFFVGEKELLSPTYTGTISVKEGTIGTYNVTADIVIPNYGKVTVNPASGSIDIKKGTPKVLTYNVNESTINGLLVDAEGWTDAHVKVVDEDNGKAHASVYYNGNKDSIVGRTLTQATPPTIDWGFAVVAARNRMMMATKAVTTQSVEYGKTATFNKVSDVSFESSNPNVFVVKEGTETGKMMIETVGVGTAAIIAKGSGSYNTGVTCLQVTVSPKPITLYAETITKVYDGTTAVNVSFEPVELIGATLDLTGVSFNFAQSTVGNNILVKPSRDIVLKNDNEALASAANYTLEVPVLKGAITPRELTFTGKEVNKYYDGTNTVVLTDYAATGLIDGEAIPALIATFTSNGKSTVATGLDVTLKLQDENGNYTLAETTGLKGNIVKSTIDAVLPDGASNETNLIEKVALTVRETGVKIKNNASIDYAPTVFSEGSGNNTVYYISGGDNDNYSVVYDKNQIGFKSESNPPSGGGDVEETVTITLDATTKDLPRTEEFVLTATVSPAGKTVTWSSSDPTVASVTADGNKVTVKGVKVGKATITATIGDVTATCEVTVGFATGLEEALANTEVFGRKGNIYVNPIQPLQVTVVNMIGKIVYNARISGNTQIPVTKGIYIVKLTNAGNSIVTKVNVY